MTRGLYTLLIGLATAHQASASGPLVGSEQRASLAGLDSLIAVHERIGSAAAENERWTAVALAVALGPFGGHRLFLGTGTKVPIIYTLTLGGCFGILPTIDLIHLLLKKDLSPYRNNKQVFMWVEPRSAAATPP